MREDRTPDAFITDFDSPEIVSEVYRDPLPSDGDCEFEDRDIVDLIEEERCPLADGRHDDGLHLYLDGQNGCCRCGMMAPWVKRDGCRS